MLFSFQNRLVVCIEYNLFPVKANIHILCCDRFKIVRDTKLDANTLQAMAKDHTNGIEIACELVHVGRCRMSQVMETHMGHPRVSQKLPKV